jgi:hypothetical protein
MLEYQPHIKVNNATVLALIATIADEVTDKLIMEELYSDEDRKNGMDVEESGLDHQIDDIIVQYLINKLNSL